MIGGFLENASRWRREIFPLVDGARRAESRLDHDAASGRRTDDDLPAEQPDPVAHSGKPHPGLGFALQTAAVVGDANDESP
jgi:hypothetical protein